MAAGTAFHTSLRDVARPGFLDAREDAWSMGDRAASVDESPVVVHAEFGTIVEQLAAFRSHSELASQVVHGDPTGKVLFADRADPAIIDFVPYWRPFESPWPSWSRTPLPGTAPAPAWPALCRPARSGDRCWRARRSTD